MPPILYIKNGCPWCDAALRHFQETGVRLDVRDVLADPAAFARMREISGQTKCPTLELDGFVVADFSVAEFQDALRRAPAAVRQRFAPDSSAATSAAE